MIGLTNYRVLVWILLIIFTIQDVSVVAPKSLVRQTKVSGRRMYENRVDKRSRTTGQDKDEPIRYMTRQKATLNGAKTTKSLVKKLARFLRQAYPKEIEEMARMRNPKPKRRRSLLHGMANRLIHLKHRVAGVGTEKISKMKQGCGCATSDSTTELDIDDGELDKFRLFFSDPPLCRPEPTVNEEDMMTATDLCGHECQCHTESPATDNDKEIYITRPTTRNVTKSIPTTQCSCDSQTDSE